MGVEVMVDKVDKEVARATTRVKITMAAQRTLLEISLLRNIREVDPVILGKRENILSDEVTHQPCFWGLTIKRHLSSIIRRKA